MALFSMVNRIDWIPQAAAAAAVEDDGDRVRNRELTELFTSLLAMPQPPPPT